MGAPADDIEFDLLALAVDVEGAPDGELAARLLAAVEELVAEDPSDAFEGMAHAARREPTAVAAVAAEAIRQLADAWEEIDEAAEVEA